MIDTQAYEVPLIEQLRKIPKDYRATIEFQWAEDGTPTGHHMIPVGHLAHRAADELAALKARDVVPRGCVQSKRIGYHSVQVIFDTADRANEYQAALAASQGRQGE